MTLPTSGPLSLSQIAAEFGGATPHSLSEYYAGGAYVPGGTEGINGPIPSSGSIQIRHFYGAPIAVEYALFYVTVGENGNYTEPGSVFVYGGYHRGWGAIGDTVFGDSNYGKPSPNTVCPWINNGVELHFAGMYSEDFPSDGWDDFSYCAIKRVGISPGDWRYQPRIFIDQTRSGTIHNMGIASTAGNGYYHGNIPVVGGNIAQFWYTTLGKPWNNGGQQLWSDMNGPFRVVVAQSYPFPGTPV